MAAVIVARATSAVNVETVDAPNAVRGNVALKSTSTIWSGWTTATAKTSRSAAVERQTTVTAVGRTTTAVPTDAAVSSLS
ncbi:unnamed protein product [Protopolystoma xenopodis]|uniref:Uncharacterized protein n=1 Tax=Protopolystoma xenopodis TaxID=117903 RepID=A0A3S5A9K5_9PLAT|nr:unnamed protein product [Protopolystoma xenopodis]